MVELAMLIGNGDANKRTDPVIIIFSEVNRTVADLKLPDERLQARPVSEPAMNAAEEWLFYELAGNSFLVPKQSSWISGGRTMPLSKK